MRTTQDVDLASCETVEAFKDRIRNKPGASLHGSLLCTVWSSWQNPNVHQYGAKYAATLEERSKDAIKLLENFISIADLCLGLGGRVTFEWPRYCAGFLLPQLIEFIGRWNLHSALVDGCGCGMTNKNCGPVLKMWRFLCSDARVA